MADLKTSFFSFDNMVTPGLIQVLWFLGVILAGFAMIAAIWASISRITNILMIFIIPVFLLMFRIYLEFIIVVFKIYERLKK